MFQRVWSQSSLDFWGRITELIGTIGMSKFMNSDGNQEDDRKLKIISNFSKCKH